MSRYVDVVAKGDIDYDGGGATINGDDATRYAPLKSIAYPANNGHGDWTETIVVTYTDGTQERIRGHVTDSGVIEE